jgi:glycosyltransferase involved in cell wall biosynthesis
VNPDEQGLVVPYDDDRCVGEAFLRLSRDPALRRRLGESARRRVMENFATNRVIELYEKLFEDVVDRKDLQ